MKEFLNVAKTKKYKKNGGIKIYEGDNNWVLLLPDETTEHINIYIQAENENIGENLLKKYINLVKQWIV